MAELSSEGAEVRRIDAIFDELRASGKSSEEIFVIVYEDLKQLARKMISRKPAADSIRATRLVHDIWERMFGQPATAFQWDSGQHFFSYVARAMHNLLIDDARKRHAQFRGGGTVASLDRLLESGFEAVDGSPNAADWFHKKGDQCLMLDSALRRLERYNKRWADIVYLHIYFLRIEDTEDDSASKTEVVEKIAKELKISASTVTKDFKKARGRLAHYLNKA